MRQPVSRSFFIGAAARGTAFAACWGLAPALAGGGGTDFPVTPCTITARPKVVGDPAIELHAEVSSKWTGAQLRTATAAFYARPKQVGKTAPRWKLVGKPVPLTALNDKPIEDVPADTAAIGIRLTYRGTVIPTKTPTPDQIAPFPLLKTTSQSWQVRRDYKARSRM